jgi:hypothetical protein
MRTKIIIGLIAMTLLPTQSEAKLTKYWVLKMGSGWSTPSYRVFKSPEACEAAKRWYVVQMKKLKAQIKTTDGRPVDTEAKCMNHLPYGYEIVR